MQINPWAALADQWRGIVDHRNGSGGKPDWGTRAVIFGIPVVVGVVGYVLRWDLRALVGDLLAANAVLLTVLLGVYGVFATWRDRLDSRAASRPRSEAAARRALDAAVAHILAGGVVGVALACITVVIRSIGPNRPLSAIAAALLVYLGATILAIIDSSRVAYANSTDKHARLNDEQLLRDDEA